MDHHSLCHWTFDDANFDNDATIAKLAESRVDVEANGLRFKLWNLACDLGGGKWAVPIENIVNLELPAADKSFAFDLLESNFARFSDHTNSRKLRSHQKNHG